MSENITDVIGSFGRWQKWVFAILFYIATLGSWQNFCVSFLAPNIPFHCVNSTDQCQIKHGNISLSCTEWEYDTSFYTETIVNKWDLVCDREWLVSLSKSAYMIGFLISVMMFGQISDWIGRFPVIVICYFITLISMFVSLFSTSYIMFLILRFFQAFGRTGLSATGYVLLMEVVGEKHRTIVAIGATMAWTVGFVTLPGVAFVFRNWMSLQLAILLPFIPVIFALKIIPESPRWLMMQGKTEKLEKLLKKASKMNKKDLKPIPSFDMLKKPSKENQTSVLDLFKTPQLRKRTFCMIYLWVVNAFMYYGLSYNTNDLAGDPYINFLISGAMEFPAYACLLLVVDRWGRRPTLMSFMIGAGIACGAIAFIPGNIPWLATTLAMVGKLFITASFRLIYLYTGELFPTVVRNVAIGANSMCARIGSIIAPFVKEMGKATHPMVPNIIYGLLAISSGLLTLLLPETKGRQIPDTIEEGENYKE